MIHVLPLLLVFSIPPPVDATASSLNPNSNAVCFGHRASIPFSGGRAWLPLNHRHGPCSPFPSSEKTLSTADMLRRDRLRATGITSMVAKRGDVTLPTRLGTSLDTLEYVVTVGLGTPAVTQTLLIDSGSDMSWVQCRLCPVPPCHRQNDAVFDPARSATYSAFSCGSAGCRGLSRALSNGCAASQCQYAVEYGDGSNSTGTYGSDKLTLTPAHAVHGFRFGCSHADPLITDRTAGLLGLGGGAVSLVGQTAEKAFSYCLPPTEAHSGFLTLGAPRVSAARFVVTPMHRVVDAKTFYGVRLQGITVAGRRLDVPRSVFAAGSVVDSGTVITQLPPTAYRALRAAFRKEMRMRMYPRVAPTNDFDTCFNLSGGAGAGDDRGVKLPSVALVFDRGATVELHPSGILYDGCLAFYSTVDDASVGIIGNVQQRTFEVLYDIAGQTVGFRRGAC